jgi:hypothetical protein
MLENINKLYFIQIVKYTLIYQLKYVEIKQK